MPPMSKADPPFHSSGQQTISSFFSKAPSRKRNSSPIDLTANDSDDDIPPPKKLKSGEIKSLFFIRDSSSPVPVASPSKRSSGPFERRRGIERAIIASTSQKPPCSPSDEVVALSFREKLQHRKLNKRLTNIAEGDTISPRIAGGEHLVPEPLPWEKRTNKKKGGKSSAMIGPLGLPCTPLEEEVIKFKEIYPGAVLLIQVGYKYCFFGDDAKIAGKVLGFGYGPTNNFLRTSFPVHNLKLNAKRLVAAGYKVGVVSQLETAALKKAGENRNTLFDRELTQLYTPATFVDDLDCQDDNDNLGRTTPPLMCIVETTKDSDRVLVGFTSFTPSTGDMVYDEFEDTFLRADLETRLTHLRPCELLLPGKLSAPTEKVLGHFSENSITGCVRIERFKQTLNYTEAFDHLSEFYAKESGEGLVAVITALPRHVVISLSLLLKHLSTFNLSDTLLQATFFTKFATRTHMILNSRTLDNLEIYRNQTDGSEKGTLFSVINQTKTSFGKRLLRSWIGRPLVDKTVLRERIEAVEEAKAGHSANLTLLRDLLKNLPDLARGLCSVQYGRCTPKELAILLTAFNRIGAAFPAFGDPREVGCSSQIWTDIVSALPAVHAPMKEILSSINLHRARDGDKENLWTNCEKFPALDEARLALMAVESDLAEELKKIRKLLKMPSLNYVCIGNNEFLIEIPKERVSIIPLDWSRIGSTSKVLRYHSPAIIQLLVEREQCKETLQAEVENAYKSFLRDVARHYGILRDVVNKLATADCLMSLATVAFDGNLCQPTFIDGCSLSIVGGRHPIIEQLKSDPFVPNAVTLGGDRPRSLVISGPNMGGKSSVVRMIAILVILAQIGSYVPAEQMRLGIHDTILTRMGASDELAAGRSTFMVEISETREIIQSATENSLVILDELGRGTSTFDGMAIAGAVLEHLASEIKCKTLFITHYPTLARELEVRYPKDIANMHMSFIEDTGTGGRREIRFLYKLTHGICDGSFGIECARLAGIPDEILDEATRSSARMQILMDEKARNVNAKKALQLLDRCSKVDHCDATLWDEFMTQMKIMGS